MSKVSRLEKAEEQLEATRASGRWFDALRLLDWYVQSSSGYTPTKTHPTTESVEAYRRTILAEIAFYSLQKPKAQRIQEAKEHLEQALKSNPDYVDARILLAVVELEANDSTSEDKAGIELLLTVLAPVQHRLDDQGHLLSEHRVHLRFLGATFLADALITKDRYEEALAVCRSVWAVIWHFAARKKAPFPEGLQALLPNSELESLLPSAPVGSTHGTPEAAAWTDCWESFHAQTRSLAAHRAADIAILSMVLHQYPATISACRACLGWKSPLPSLLGKDKCEMVVSVFHQALSCRVGKPKHFKLRWSPGEEGKVAEEKDSSVVVAEIDPLELEWKWSQRATAFSSSGSSQSSLGVAASFPIGEGSQPSQEEAKEGLESSESSHGAESSESYIGGILQVLHSGLEGEGINRNALVTVCEDLRLLLVYARSPLQRFALNGMLSLAEARAGQASLALRSLQQAVKEPFGVLGLRTMVAILEGGKALLSNPELSVSTSTGETVIEELQSLGLQTAEHAILHGQIPVIPLHLLLRMAALLSLRYSRNLKAALEYSEGAVEEVRSLLQNARRLCSTHDFSDGVLSSAAAKNYLGAVLTSALVYSLEALGIAALKLSRAGAAHTEAVSHRLRAIQAFRRSLHVFSAFRSGLAGKGEPLSAPTADLLEERQEAIGLALKLCDDWQLCFHLGVALCDAAEYEEAAVVIRHAIALPGSETCAGVWAVASLATCVVSGPYDALRVVVSGLDALPDSPLLFWVSAEIAEELVSRDSSLTLRMESGDLTITYMVVLRWYASAVSALSRTEPPGRGGPEEPPRRATKSLMPTDLLRIMRRALAGLSVPERLELSAASKDAPKPLYEVEPRSDVEWMVHLLCSVARACARGSAPSDALAFLRAADALTDASGTTSSRYALGTNLHSISSGNFEVEGAAPTVVGEVEPMGNVQAHPRLRAEVVYTAGYLHEACGAMLAAEAQYAAAIALWPFHARALTSMAALALDTAQAYSTGTTDSGGAGERRFDEGKTAQLPAPVTVADIRAVVDRARGYAVRSLRVDPNDSLSWNTYGRVLTMEGDSDGATRSLTKALKLNKNSPPFWSIHVPLIY